MSYITYYTFSLQTSFCPHFIVGQLLPTYWWFLHFFLRFLRPKTMRKQKFAVIYRIILISGNSHRARSFFFSNIQNIVDFTECIYKLLCCNIWLQLIYIASIQATPCTDCFQATPRIGRISYTLENFKNLITQSERAGLLP